MNAKGKTLKKQYRQSPRQMGVYQLRNLVSEKVLIGAALNLPAILNRHQFALRQGHHPNRQLQADWNEFGSEHFAFEILDELAPRDDPEYDYRADLDFLEALWLEKLQPYGDQGYNERKKGREERLRMIAQRRADARSDKDDADDL